MISLILLLIGIGLAIVDSNGILIIDQWIIYLTFGLAAIIFIIELVQDIIVRKKANKHFDNVRSRFDKFKF